MTKRPLEFVIEQEEEALYKILYFYEDGSKEETYSHSIPRGLELKKRYSIGDIKL